MSEVGQSATDAVLLATLPGRLLSHARVRGDRPALRVKRLGVWQPISWLEYARDVAATARALADVGVGSGDGVAILSDNRPEWLFADLAAQLLGARAVGVYQTNPSADVAYVVNDASVDVLFCEDQEQVDKALEFIDSAPSLRHVVVFDPRGTRHIDDARLLRWDRLLARGHELLEAEDGGAIAWAERCAAAIDPNATSMVVYTSGTTGPPKGAMLSSANVVAMSASFAETVGVTDKDTVLSYLPLCHVAEKIFSQFLPMATGAVVHFGESIETVQADLREVSPTVFLGVPRIWEKINAGVSVKMKDSSPVKRALYNYFARRGRAIAARDVAGESSLWDKVVWGLGDLLVYRPLQERLGLRNCRLAVTGAAPIAPELIEWFRGLGVTLHEGYGMTESAGVSHVNPVGGVRIGSVGKPLPQVECRLAEDDEILIRGPNVFLGYLGRPEATAESIDDDGWLHTGDIGSIDDDGYLSVTGRKKEIIITAGGKNLSPEKIENALKTSAYIKEAIAIGDRRKFIAALVQIESDSVGDWAQRSAITYTSFEDLAAKPEVVELIDQEIARANEQLARVEQVRSFRLLPKELNQDDGELTATQKVRRSAVHDSFAPLIEEIYR